MGYDYDLFVIGGGSGGLAASKRAAGYGKKVAVADFVKPSPAGTTWGLGGTCVNVGCIPKKLMHTSALIGEAQADAHGLGWDTQASHDWHKMVSSVNNYIKSLNWGQKTDLKSKNVTYINKFASFVDDHTLKLTDKDGNEEQVTAETILIATGGRPNLGGYEGAEECCISSDDIFWQKKAPGKTLVVGAAYISLECAGFLTGLGFDVTVMVRSILLRGFDQEIADKIGAFMEKSGTKFARGLVPSKFEKTEDGRVRVFTKDGEFGIYDTVLLAIGRTGCATWVNLENAGVTHDGKGKIPVDATEKTNKDNIYAIGDVVQGMLELTPVAMAAGQALADRLYGGATKLMDYKLVPTTVFTPLEYGSIGYGEEEAFAKFGKENIIVYQSPIKPLHWATNPNRGDDCYVKLICNKTEKEKVVGVHLLCPDAGEIIQGVAIAVRVGATKADFDDTIGIHPTVAEMITTVTQVKKDGQQMEALGGC